MKTKTNKSQLTFILYSFNKLPLVYKLNKNFLKFFLVSPVILLSLSILIFLILYNFDIIKQNLKKNTLQQANTQLSSKILENKISIKKLKVKNDELLRRLKQGMNAQGINHFSIFQSIPGQKYLPSEIIEIANFKLTSLNKKVQISFNLLNKTEGKKKIAGYLFFLIQTDTGMAVWPKQDSQTFQFNYSSGESFSTSRFRPFKFSIKQIKNTSQLYKILIFNRLGDLIYIQESSQ